MDAASSVARERGEAGLASQQRADRRRTGEDCETRPMGLGSSAHRSSHPVTPSSQPPHQSTGRHLEVYQVSYEDAKEQEYLVRTLGTDQLLRVSKRYVPSEPSRV